MSPPFVTSREQTKKGLDFFLACWRLPLLDSLEFVDPILPPVAWSTDTTDPVGGTTFPAIFRNSPLQKCLNLQAHLRMNSTATASHCPFLVDGFNSFTKSCGRIVM